MNLTRILLLGLSLTLLTLTSGNHPTTLTSETKSVAAASSEKPPILLADEVIRRLRRLGLNFVKTRVPHPYDPLDNLC